MFLLMVKSTVQFVSATFRSIGKFCQQYFDIYFGDRWLKVFVKNRKYLTKSRKIIWPLEHAIDSYVFPGVSRAHVNQPRPGHMAERDCIIFKVAGRYICFQNI